MTRARVEGHTLHALCDDWQVAPAQPGLTYGAELDHLDWIAARVPGTAAAAMRDAGRWQPRETQDFDAEDWWFRTRFTAEPALAGEEVRLRLDGIATVAEVYLNGDLVLESGSMFAAHSLDVGERLRSENDLVIRCHALRPLLAVRRRPRARWRTQIADDGGLRFFRTTLLGRAPGFAPGPAAVGPWRSVALERRRRLAVERLRLRTRLDGENGVLSLSARILPLEESVVSSVKVELDGPSGTHRSTLTVTADERDQATGFEIRGDLVVPDVARWWPHTHGDPALHEVRLLVERPDATVSIDAGKVGFRDLGFGGDPGYEPERDGLDVHVNGVPIFARGAVWTPLDAIGLSASESDLRRVLGKVKTAGMNMLRLPGTGIYETAAFHDLCDELGILVWQDLMFANFDYPFLDEDFRALVEREASSELEAVAGRPSLAVICGNSEIEQQVAMLGLDPSLGRGAFFAVELPDMVAQLDIDAAYVPSAPCGGALPFRPDHGIANYYGVGGYQRPLTDVRRAGVRFAAECLAFSNVPDERAVERVLSDAPARLAVHHPAWKAGVPRDMGAGWDFEDVRDHYLELLFDLDAAQLRRVDHERYLELSRAVTGEVMAEVFGEWRRAASPCNGGLVLWLSDLIPGAGWGVLDELGTPKVAFHHLRRAFAPVAVWMIDEGLGGVEAHVANECQAPLTASLRISLYRDLQRRVEEVHIPVELAPHSQSAWNVEAALGRFVDASWAYRFGPPAQDLIVASLERLGEQGTQLLSQAVLFPAGRPTAVESAESLGLQARASPLDESLSRLSVRSSRLAYGVRVHVPGHVPDDDAFSIEPGGERSLLLRRCDSGTEPAAGTLTALNLDGRVRIVQEAS
jgi:beta-mannosidase